MIVTMGNVTFGAEAKVPITITQRMLEEERKTVPWESRRIQCPAIYASSTRSRSAVFCVRHKDHEGDHRGDRAQWRRT